MSKNKKGLKKKIEKEKREIRSGAKAQVKMHTIRQIINFNQLL